MTLYYNEDSRTAIPEINCKWLSVKATHFLFSQNNSGLHYQKQPPEKVFYRKNGVLKKLSKFTGKHLCQSLFFNKATCLRPATLYKKRLVQVFSCEFCKNFKNFLTEHLRMPASQNICSIKKLPWKVYQNSQEKGLSFMKFRLTTYSFTKKEPYIWPRCFSVNFSENFNSNLFIRQNQLPRGVL